MALEMVHRSTTTFIGEILPTNFSSKVHIVATAWLTPSHLLAGN